ncbi:hypothetical protein EB796_023741 [Bugula neritina]|uniref:Uncharacterized protein n=1 Tax=Bugula neritina TaxID=10212 RepID=A0A7J7IX33_BUGNE|nr:hypothetical protein EB796_023741 [Bugula neritina]
MSFTPSLSSNYYVDTLDSAKSSNIHSRKKLKGPTLLPAALMNQSLLAVRATIRSSTCYDAMAVIGNPSQQISVETFLYKLDFQQRSIKATSSHCFLIYEKKFAEASCLEQIANSFRK